MIQQHNNGVWSPASFSNSCNVLLGEAISQSFNPQTGGQGIRIYDTWRQDGPGMSLGIG